MVLTLLTLATLLYQYHVICKHVLLFPFETLNLAKLVHLASPGSYQFLGRWMAKTTLCRFNSMFFGIVYNLQLKFNCVEASTIVLYHAVTCLFRWKSILTFGWIAVAPTFVNNVRIPALGVHFRHL